MDVRVPVFILLIIVSLLAPLGSKGVARLSPADMLASPAASSSPPRYSAPPNFFGMVVRDPYYEWDRETKQVRRDFVDAMMANLKTAGVEWIRFEFHADWSSENNGYGTIDLEQADYFVNSAHRHGLKVLALINTGILAGPNEDLWNFNDYPNQNLYCVKDKRGADPWNIGCGVTPYIEHFLTRALKIAAHYSGRIDAYELFNEQNHYYGMVAARTARDLPYQDILDPVRVARIITKFFRILREQEDTTPVIVGGIHPADSISPWSMTDLEYLGALYESESFQGYRKAHNRWPIDGVAYHPYPREMRERFLSDNDFLHLVPDRLREVIAAIRNYDRRSKLWITEIGTQGDYQDGADMRRQADFLRTFYQHAWYMRKDIYTVMWFKQEDWVIKYTQDGRIIVEEHPWGIVHMPYKYEDQTSYPDPWRYGGDPVDPTKWQIKPGYVQYQDLALNGFPQMQVYLPLLQKGSDGTPPTN